MVNKLALFSGLGIMGILIILIISAIIVGVLIWYFDYYLKPSSENYGCGSCSMNKIK